MVKVTIAVGKKGVHSDYFKTCDMNASYKYFYVVDINFEI